MIGLTPLRFDINGFTIVAADQQKGTSSMTA